MRGLQGQVDGILSEFKITDTKVVNRLKPSLLPLKNRADRVAFLTDLGHKVPTGTTTGKTSKVLNRGTGAGGTETTEESVEQPDEKAQQARATKVMNRANQLCKDTPGLSLATATVMADKEVE